MQLKKEHGEEKHVKQGGRLQQLTLFNMLDVLDDAVIAVNESEEIRFCNRAGENLLRHPDGDLRGREIWSIFRAKTAEVLRPFLCSLNDGNLPQGEQARVLRVGLEERSGTTRFVNVQIVPLLSESSVYYLFILKCPGNASGFIWQRRHDSFGNFVEEELAGIQERLKSLDTILPSMLPEPSAKTGEILFGLSEINRFFARVNLLLQPPLSHGNDRRFFAVEVMNLCVEYWLKSGRADKFDLARDSRLWTVYTNPDGWERTQTLDKYFDLSTLPKRTNWKKILATADFVLNSCPDPSPLREKLEKSLAQLHFSLDEQPRFLF